MHLVDPSLEQKMNKAVTANLLYRVYENLQNFLNTVLQIRLADDIGETSLEKLFPEATPFIIYHAHGCLNFVPLT